MGGEPVECRCLAEHGPGGVDDGWQHLERHTEQTAHTLVPAAAVGADQAGDRGVARVGDVDGALGEDPGDPGIDGAEAEVAAVHVGCVGEQPPDLGG